MASAVSPKILPTILTGLDRRVVPQASELGPVLITHCKQIKVLFSRLLRSSSHRYYYTVEKCQICNGSCFFKFIQDIFNFLFIHSMRRRSDEVFHCELVYAGTIKIPKRWRGNAKIETWTHAFECLYLYCTKLP